MCVGWACSSETLSRSSLDRAGVLQQEAIRPGTAAGRLVRLPRLGVELVDREVPMHERHLVAVPGHERGQGRLHPLTEGAVEIHASCIASCLQIRLGSKLDDKRPVPWQRWPHAFLVHVRSPSVGPYARFRPILDA